MIGSMTQVRQNLEGVEYLLCDGRELSVEDYPELYNSIGREYGPGREGDTLPTFRIPDMRGLWMHESQDDMTITPETTGDDECYLNRIGYNE